MYLLFVVSVWSLLGNGTAQNPNLFLTSASDAFCNKLKISSSVKSSLFSSLLAINLAASRKSFVAARSTSTGTCFSTSTIFSTIFSTSTIVSTGFADSNFLICSFNPLFSLTKVTIFCTLSLSASMTRCGTITSFITSTSLITSTGFSISTTRSITVSTGFSIITSLMISFGLLLFSFLSWRTCFWSSRIFFFGPLLFHLR